MAALDVYRTAYGSSPGQEAARSILVLWVVLDHFAVGNGLADLLYRDASYHAGIDGVLGELESIPGKLLAQLLNHFQIRKGL